MTPTDIKFRIIRRVSQIFFYCIVFFGSFPALAMELVMVEQDICPFCKQFDLEVATQYSESDIGKSAPLRRVQLNNTWPSDLKDIQHDMLTPTFILIDDNGREMGRLRGYPGKQEFLSLISDLINNLGR